MIDHDNNTLESFEFILDKKVFACKIADKGKTIMNCIIEAVSIFEEWFNNATNEDRIKIVGRISDEIDFKLIEGNTSVCRITSKRTRYKYELIIGNECNISELLSVLKLYDRKLIPRMLLYYVAGVYHFNIVETLDN